MIRSGDTFRFLGLLDQNGVRVPSDRTITIHSISVSGQVSFKITLDVDRGGSGESLHSAPLERVLLLIDKGIWSAMRYSVQ